VVLYDLLLDHKLAIFDDGYSDPLHRRNAVTVASIRNRPILVLEPFDRLVGLTAIVLDVVAEFFRSAHSSSGIARPAGLDFYNGPSSPAGFNRGKIPRSAPYLRCAER